MNVDFYRSQFDEFITGLADGQNSFVDDRKQAFDWFAENGLPNKKDEAWQFTDLSELQKKNFSILKNNNAKIDSALIAKILIPNSNRIVFVNGILDTALSEYGNNLKIDISNSIAQTTTQFSNAFTALNGSLRQGGYVISINKNYGTEHPIHIINYISNDSNNVQFNQYNKILIEENNSVLIIEEQIIYGNRLFHNNMTDIIVDRNASLDHVVLQNNDPRLLEINNYFIKQADDSNYNAQFITKNGALIRNDLDVQINGQNCDTSIFGLALLDGKDHIENYTNMIHAEPHCNSRQLFKYILRDSAEGVFNGLVKVQPDAQQTDSQQTNRNILLSKKALMNSNPQLEIYADDVKCSHGSATGELDDDAIFYLRSRGLDLETAKTLLIEGFVKEIIQQIKNDTFKERVNLILQKWLVN